MLPKEEKLSLESRYKEVGENYRYYLNWRNYLFAGYIAVLGFVISKTIDLYDEKSIFCFIIPFLASLIGIVFRTFDNRIREIYDTAIKTGSQLENGKPGFYKNINVAPKFMSHSRVLGFVYYGASGILFLSSIALILVFFLGN